MKICGIICEYNPLHYGHIKLIDYAKSVADTVVCVMSGNFTQRGESAIADKYDRARHACLAGADLVIELPTIFATSSASDFAYGGISILQSINADYYAFGSECGDISLLNNCADCLNSDSTQLEIARLIDAGNNYPTACAFSLKKIDQKYEIIDKPNNLLGIMYLSTAKQLSYKGIPLTIKRDDNYNNNNLEDIITSSSAIRNNLNSSNLSRYLPPYVDNLCNITDKFNDYARLLLSTSNVQALRNTAQVTEGIENRIINSVATTSNYQQLIDSIKTKRYTMLKIKRIITNYALGITKELVKLSKTVPPYINILSVKREREDILSYLSQIEANIVPNLGCNQQKLYDIDINAEKLYLALQGKLRPKNTLRKI